MRFERGMTMKITNIANKIVNIGSTVLLPGDSVEAATEYVGNDSIKRLAKIGFISITGGVKTNGAAVKMAAEVKADAEKKFKARADAKAKADAAAADSK